LAGTLVARLQRWIRQLPLSNGQRFGRFIGGAESHLAGSAATSATSEAQALAGLESENPHCRWDSAAFLGRNPHRSRETITALVGALGDPEEFVRWQAARALAAQEPAHVFPALTEALTDEDPLRRAGAAEAMGYQGGEAAAVTLCRHSNDGDAQVRSAVAQALRDLGDTSAVRCLLPLLADQDAGVRCSAAAALGRIGNPATAQALADALSQPAQPLLVRRALAAALVRAAHPEAQPILMVALSDPDPQVRGYAAEALGQIGDESAGAALASASSDEGVLLNGTVGGQARRALTMLERRGHRPSQTN
jgi:HEAT repeat protein